MNNSNSKISVFFCGKLFLFLIIAFFIVEILLRLWATSVTEHNSLDFFMKTVPYKLKTSGKDAIFFIGDSTVYGLGGSNPAKFSLPAQFRRLVQEKKPTQKVIDLSYPATCTEDHLTIMEMLPNNATVLYRGGITDKWIDRKNDSISLFGIKTELHSLKMISLFFPGFRMISGKKRNLLIEEKLKHIMQQKKLNLYTIDYTTMTGKKEYTFFHIPTESSPVTAHIPLRKMLENAGYMEEGLFKKEFTNEPGSHPNDLGHYIEALFLLKFICSENLLGFSMENFPENENLTQQLNHIKDSYEKNKAILYELSTKLFNTKNYMKIMNLVFETWKTSEILMELEPENTSFVADYENLKKVSSLIFHDSRTIATINAELILKTNKSDSVEKRLYILIRQLLSAAANGQKNIFANLSLSGEISEKNIHIINFSPFPLELCPAFHKVAKKYQLENFSTKNEWESLFSIPYDFFNKKTPEVCQL